MKNILGLIILIVCSFTQLTQASSSLSCSGHVKLCSTCASNYYYIYAYQYAYVTRGEVRSESHSFNMSGFLGDSNSYKIQVSASNRHVFYSNGQYLLAIPYQNSADGIWINASLDSGPGEAPATWIKLCPTN